MKRLALLFLTAAIFLSGCHIAKDQDTKATVSTGTVASSVSSVPPATMPPDPLDILLEGMTLREKVGQLFLVAPEQFFAEYRSVTAVTAKLKAGLSQYPVGGIILFAENIATPEQLTALNEDLQASVEIPLFLAVDEEGGRVARLANNGAFDLPKYESAASVGASGDPEDARKMGKIIGTYLKEYGFNLDFAPVADVNTNPKNPIIGNRAFSSDPVIARKMADAFADGLTGTGMIATFKHFPGHGDTAEDSHSGLAVSRKNKEELENCEWLPFLEADSADLVMVGHIALPEVTGDMTPATMSYEIVTDILKKDLGFSGLVITDAMNMGAITESFSSGKAAVAALQAGCDIILMPDDLPSAFNAVVDAVEDGTLGIQWLDDTVRRILQFKQEHGILTLETENMGEKGAPGN